MSTIQKLPRRLALSSDRSTLLLGPRRVGKSTLLQGALPGAMLVDLLQTDVFFEYRMRPSLLRERVAATTGPVVIDEIQLIPELIREVHHLIESQRRTFILCGSSARKLRKEGVTNLAGRLHSRYLMPLTSLEIPDFDLDRALQYGTLPPIWFAADPADELRHYCGDYLREEVQAERLVRRLDSFTRFLEAAAVANGGILNYTNIARDAGVTTKTIQDYYEILEDTLIGFHLPAWTKSKKRRAIRASKFYFFDCGIPTTLLRQKLSPKTPEYGRAFEHFVMLETRAAMHYERKFETMHYWRSASGLEVDLVIDDHTAVEIKSGRVHAIDAKGLQALAEDMKLRNRWIVTTDPERRELGDGTLVMGWHEYATRLESGSFK